MHTHKIILALLSAGILAESCNNFGTVTSTTELDDLRSELAESNERASFLQKQYIEQNKEMSGILEDLAAISGKTASLRIDVENGSARLTQAEQISGSIARIKERIEALKDENADIIGKNRELQKVIDGFNNVIKEQENQINVLTEEIKSKDKTIKAQKDTIDSQYSTILAQKDELQKKVREQAAALCEAGELLEEIGDNAPEVSWKKNKEKMGNMVQDIYRKALGYYEQALAAGHEPARERISSIKAKIVE